jgi:hypothetical protein
MTITLTNIAMVIMGNHMGNFRQDMASLHRKFDHSDDNII